MGCKHTQKHWPHRIRKEDVDANGVQATGAPHSYELEPKKVNSMDGVWWQ
jgi:hypothetical protein